MQASNQMGIVRKVKPAGSDKCPDAVASGAGCMQLLQRMGNFAAL